MGPTWAKMGSTWAKLAPSWAMMGPTWGQLGANLGQDGANLGQNGVNLGQDGANLGQDGANLGQARANLGHDRANLGQDGADLGLDSLCPEVDRVSDALAAALARQPAVAVHNRLRKEDTHKTCTRLTFLFGHIRSNSRFHRQASALAFGLTLIAFKSLLLHGYTLQMAGSASFLAAVDRLGFEVPRACVQCRKAMQKRPDFLSHASVACMFEDDTEPWIFTT
eukprot:s126_g57.t1